MEWIDRIVARLGDLADKAPGSLEECRRLFHEALQIWLDGGLAMAAIALDALIMFGLGVHVALELRSKAHRSVPEKTWKTWIAQPRKRRGPIGRLLDIVTGGRTIEDTVTFCQGLRRTESAVFERDLKVMKICVGTAPLLGLFGTVTGMLATFAALSTGSGGDQTMGMIAKGISEALITTETGLVVALPGLFFHYHLNRRFEGYKTFLAHLETVCTQHVYREQGSTGGVA